MLDVNSVSQFLSNFLHVLELIHIRAYKKTEDGKTTGINKTYHKNGIDWQELDRLNQDGYNIAFVVNSQGHKSSDIELGTTVFFEHDYDSEGNKIPLEVQREIPRKLGLPEPTVIVFTGNKSLQQHYCFDLPCPIDDRNRLQADLLAYTDADRSLTDAARCMRLPGFRHPSTGNIAVVYGGCGKRYLYHELRELVPETTPQTKQTTTLDVDVCLDEAEDRLRELGLLGYRTESDEVTKHVNLLGDAQPGTRHTTLVDKAVYLGALCVESGLDIYHILNQVSDAVAHWDNPYKTQHTLEACFLIGLAKGIHNMTSWGTPDSETQKALTIEADVTVEREYLEDDDYKHKHLAVKSGKGTGKTERIKEVLKQYIGKRVLFICHRVFLVKGACERQKLVGAGLVPYDVDLKADWLAITFDSLNKVDTTAYDLIIIDEVSQGLQHLCFAETAIENNRLEVYTALVTGLQSAERTLFLDADLNTATINWLRDVVKLPLTVLCNNYCATITLTG